MIDELRRKYEALFGPEPSPPNAVAELETRLGIQMPADFKEIARFYSGGYLGGKSLNAVASGGGATNIGDETERLRVAINLPKNMVVLAEPAASLIVMECVDNKGKVIWLDATDAPKLSDPASLRSPEIWESYSAFFAALLAEEEEERGYA